MLRAIHEENDERLVSYFVEWHQTKSLGDIVLTTSPKLLKHQYEKGSTYSVSELDTDQIIGSITFRSDAQCDAEAIDISSEQPLFTKYCLLVNEREIDEFLTYSYTNVRAQNCSGQKGLTTTELESKRVRE